MGIWKKSVASLADRASAMNRWSCHDGIPDLADGLSARRDRKNEVDMMSNCQPCLRAIASAFGTFGCSMYPNFNDTREKRLDIGVIRTRSSSGTRGVSAVMIVRITLFSCSTLLCLRLCSNAVGANSGSLVRKTAVPGTKWGGFFSRLRNK